MESTIKRILEAFKITPSKDKPFDRESQCNIFAEKVDYEAVKSCKGKDKISMKNAVGADRSLENRRIRKYGVPSKFYPRSQSWETQTLERSWMGESGEGLTLRRNSSLDSETERYCMRHEEAGRSTREQDNCWNNSGSEENVTSRSNNEVCDLTLNEYWGEKPDKNRMNKSFNSEARTIDIYSDKVAPGSKQFSSTEVLPSKISSETARITLDHKFNQLRCTDDRQSTTTLKKAEEGYESIIEGHNQEDISGYERWINTSAFPRQQGPQMDYGAPRFRYSVSNGFEYGKDNRGVNDLSSVAKESSSSDEPNKSIVADINNTKGRSNKRQASRLCRQERIDMTYATTSIQCEFDGMEASEARGSEIPVLGNQRQNSRDSSETWRNQCGKFEIRVSNCSEDNDWQGNRDETFGYYDRPSRYLGTDLDREEEDFIDDPYTAYSMGRDLRFVQGDASRRSMKLRRDSPFAFPLIEEFARNANRMSEGCYKKQARRSPYRNAFSGNVGCFLESQQLGTMSFGDNVMRISK